MAELRSVSEKLLNRGDVVLNIGLRQTLSDRFKLLASVGTGLGNGREATSFIAYLGVQLVLGRSKQKLAQRTERRGLSER